MKKYFAVFMAVCLLFTGCEKRNDNTEETTTPPETTAPEPEPYPVVINEISIGKTPETIVCLSPALTEILYEMGFGDNITGRSDYCDYPASVLEKPSVGSSAGPDIDAIIQIHPELVLTATPIASKDMLRMSEAGINTLLIPSPGSIKEFSSVYTAMGLLMYGMFQGKEKGEQFFSDISHALDNPSAISFGKFVYVTENLDIAGEDTLEGDILSCFGVNLAAGASRYSFDKNLLLEDQPDVILLNSRYTIDDLYADELYSQLDATVNGRVLYVDNGYFERPSARMIKFLKQLTEDFKSMG